MTGPGMGMAEPLQRTKAQLADSIAQLVGELNRLKAEKKNTVASYNERIKELELDIAGEQMQYDKMSREGRDAY